MPAKPGVATTRLSAVDESANSEAAAVFAEIRKTRGNVSHVLRSLGHAPQGLGAFAGYGEYVRYRKSGYAVTGTPALFLNSRGKRVCHCNLSGAFHQLTKDAGINPRSRLCRPRIHDLRHSFAIRTMLDWYRAGVDVEARLPLLSTVHGDVNPATTYHYLSAAPELLALAGERLERHLEEDC